MKPTQIKENQTKANESRPETEKTKGTTKHVREKQLLPNY